MASTSLSELNPYPTPTRNAVTTSSANTSISADSISLSPTLTPTDQAGVYIGSDGYKFIKCDEVLTDSDKALIKGINGGKLDGGSLDASYLIQEIALDRVNGSLTGDITPAFLTQLVQNNQMTSKLDLQQASFYSTNGNNIAAQAYTNYAVSPGISNSFLKQALAYLSDKGIVG